jgi:hypothetical protein
VSDWEVKASCRGRPADLRAVEASTSLDSPTGPVLCGPFRTAPASRRTEAGGRRAAGGSSCWLGRRGISESAAPPGAASFCSARRRGLRPVPHPHSSPRQSRHHSPPLFVSTERPRGLVPGPSRPLCVLHALLFDGRSADETSSFFSPPLRSPRPAILPSDSPPPATQSFLKSVSQPWAPTLARLFSS